ncbi:MAG TPA: HlyC/CorC family transporter [Chloroflexi bacterium]|nr:HlyC/CorC family transporter [Chloroflexota bacterium]
MGAFLIPILVIVVLILLNGLFVAAEFALLGVRPTRVAQLADEGNRTAGRIKAILDDPRRQDRYFATTQIGVTLASLGLGMYGEHTVAAWLLGPFERWLRLSPVAAHSIAGGIAIALLTFAHVVGGEIVPKSLALQYAERAALGLAGLMALMKRLFFPAIVTLNAIGHGVLRLLGIPATTARTRLYSPEELELIVSESHAGGLVTKNEQQLFQNIFDFSERRVGRVMTPRPRIIAVPLGIDEAALRGLVATSPHSRFPVYLGDLDHVVGLLLLQDFVRQQLEQPGQFDLRALLRHMPTVPEAMPVDRLLAAFKRSHIHMALAVDEYGGTAGVVTLEDLVEEVVGEVRDEFDLGEQPPLRQVEPGILLARGDLLLEDLVEEVPIPLPKEKVLPDVETVGGLVVALLGRPPRPGDQVTLDGATSTVEAVRGLAVGAVRIVLAEDDRAHLRAEEPRRREGRV